MKIDVNINFDKNFIDDKAMAKYLFDLANKCVNFSKQNINQISHGRKYGNHIASKAGDAPNTDTGNLINSLQIKVKNNLEIEFGSYGTSYALSLELGTKKMSPRPFILPSVDKYLK